MTLRCVRLLLAAAMLLALCGCAGPASESRQCTVVLEDNDALYFQRQVWSVPRYASATVTVGVPTGHRIAHVSYDDYSVSARTGASASYDYYTLTLHQVRYSVLIRIETAPAYTTAYHIGGGEPVCVAEDSPHLFCNTLPYDGRVDRPGYLAVGWSTGPDGTGTRVGFGSRLDRREQSHVDLYPLYLPCTPESAFTWTERDGEAVVTGYSGDGDVVLPAALGCCPVTAIAAGAFQDLAVQTLALPPTLRQVEPGAFSGVTAQHLYFFDTIADIGDDGFPGCAIAHIHIQAARPPVYSGSYFDTFPDKMDLLHSLRDRQKIVLFGGSAVRFGYDSAMLEEAFPEYRVVNMGVYAYSNMRPLAELVLPLTGQGDILLSSPELDAIDCQFCGETALGKELFCMAESNYDLLAGLDCRGYTGFFDAFQAFNRSREGMAPRSYAESPADYDEDGAPQLSPSYDLQGDYILYRPANTDGKLFGVKRAAYDPACIRPEDLAGLNRVYDAFAARGVTVLFTYSPRSAPSVTDGSTPDAVAALDALFREQLHAQILSPIDRSLMDPYYFFGTDNHLSTEGAALHTRQVIGDLQAALAQSP